MIPIDKEAARRGLRILAGTRAPYLGGWFVYETGNPKPVMYTEQLQRLVTFVVNSPLLPPREPSRFERFMAAVFGA